ncbi:hypothetical protein QTP88_002142 [Uroleucon formosanum]
MTCTSTLIRKLFNEKKFTAARTKTREVAVNVIAPFAVQLTIDDLKTVDFVSILVDASNHKAIKLVPVIVRYFSPTTGVRNKILEFSNLPGETADLIHNQIIKVLNNFNLTEKIISYSADNTNTNFGGLQRKGKNNVFIKLKETLNREILGMGCYAHIIHNSIQCASDCLPIDIESIIICVGGRNKEGHMRARYMRRNFEVNFGKQASGINMSKRIVERERVNVMTRHFEALTLRPILRHQLRKQSRLLWRFSQSAAEFISIKSFISSAKHKSLHKGKALRTLLTNSKNRIGDKCPPWGTPDVDEKIFDLMPNNFTHCSLFSKKEPNQESKGSPKPDVSRILIESQKLSAIELTIIMEDLMQKIENKRQEKFLTTEIENLVTKFEDEGLINRKNFENKCDEFYTLCYNYLKNWNNSNQHVNQLKSMLWITLTPKTIVTWENVKKSVQFINNVMSKPNSVTFDEETFFEQFKTFEKIFHQQNDEWHHQDIEDKWLFIFKTFADNNQEFSMLLKVVEFSFVLPGSNAAVERVFSLMNNTWTNSRNKLDIKTVEASLIIKTSFNNTSCEEFYKQILENKSLLRQVHGSAKYLALAKSTEETLESENSEDGSM